MGPDPAHTKGNENESPFHCFMPTLELLALNDTPAPGQNSAPLLANKVFIKLLLWGQNISFSSAFRKNSMQH